MRGFDKTLFLLVEFGSFIVFFSWLLCGNELSLQLFQGFPPCFGKQPGDQQQSDDGKDTIDEKGSGITQVGQLLWEKQLHGKADP